MARILVVEDSQTLISTVEWLLRQNGHEVYVARDGLAALASVRALLPDLMLLDILLPHVDGFELCTIIRGQHAHHAMPIIVMSSLKDQSDIQHAYDVGANAYITKPFTNDELLAIIKQHLVSTDAGAPIV